MNSEWPIRAETPRPRPVFAPTLNRPYSAARRLADATLDLRLNEEHRVDDRLRASVAAMRDDLVGGVERKLRSALLAHFADQPEIAASLSSLSVGIVLPLLRDAGTLAYSPLIAILLRRAEEFVLARRLVASSDEEGLPVDDADPEIAEVAMAMLVADARRLDRFGEPALLFDDLPAELAAWLVWQVAAAMRFYLREHHGVGDARADAVLTATAAILLGNHDEGRGLHAVAARLAAALAAAERIDEPLLEQLLRTGRMAAFSAALAAVLGLPATEIWHVVADPTDGRLAIVLRAADVSRETAAEILLRLIPAGGDAASEIAMFDACDPETAGTALAPLSEPADYRAAVQALIAALASAGVTA